MAMSEAAWRYERRFSLYTMIAAGIWLVFLAPAVQEGWAHRETVAGWLGLLSITAFAVVYVWSFHWSRPRRRSGLLLRRVDPAAASILLALLALGAAMVLTLGGPGLGFTVYVAVAGVMLVPIRWSLPLAVVLAAIAEALARMVPGWEGAQGISVSVGLATFAVWGMWQAMRRTMDLAQVREENARLAVGQERARMARDLHDILGHSLTVITVKAELAGRLLDADPERVRAEVADIERLARDALADVRRTVEGYRDLSLVGEISRARAALDAAEIDADLPGSTDDVPSQWRELFAWTVREGVTNVVRHSAARHCTVRLMPDRVCIADDGRGWLGAQGAGHGLAGLHERAADAGARLLVESPAGGGFSVTMLASAAVPPDCPPAGPEERRIVAQDVREGAR